MSDAFFQPCCIRIGGHKYVNRETLQTEYTGNVPDASRLNNITPISPPWTRLIVTCTVSPDTV